MYGKEYIEYLEWKENETKLPVTKPDINKYTAAQQSYSQRALPIAKPGESDQSTKYWNWG